MGKDRALLAILAVLRILRKASADIRADRLLLHGFWKGVQNFGAKQKIILSVLASMCYSSAVHPVAMHPIAMHLKFD